MHELPGESRERPLIVVPTPVGPAEFDLAAPTGPPGPTAARGLLVLGHGAGGSIAAADLVAVVSAARAEGFHVARVRQPYSVAGRRAPAPADQLDLAWTTVVEAIRAGLAHLPLVVGGRSSGARVACRTAAATGARGVLALAFPLHPPGHPEKSRAAELDIDVPLLVLQGARDPFGTPPEFPSHVTIHEVAAADHRLAGPGFGAALAAVAAWLAAVAAQ